MNTLSPSIAQDAFRAGFGAHMTPLSRPDEPCHNVPKEQWGKAPAVKRASGWFPSSIYHQHDETEATAILWDSWGANIGLVCWRDARLVAIDGDLDDVDLLTIFDTTREKHFPGSPTRRVAHPHHYRMLLPVRVSDVKVRGTTLTWSKGSKQAKIDVLSEGKQFAAWGVHPRTRAPYVWSQPITQQIDGVYAFPEITFAQLDAFLADLTEAFAFHGWVRAAGGKLTQSASVGTRKARVGTEAQVRAWMALVPNDSRFDNYRQWDNFAYAIWAASEGSAWGRDIWLEWSSQRNQKPGVPEKSWDDIKGTRNDGLDWIRDMARELNPDAAAQLDFKEAPIDQDVVDAIASDALSKTIWAHIQPRFVYIIQDNCFYDIEENISISRESFDGKFAKVALRMNKELYPKSEKTEPKASTIALKQPDLISVSVRTYRPGAPLVTTDPEGRRAVNMWAGPEIKSIPVSAADVQPWLDHVEYVLGSKADADLFMKWVTLVAKYPHIKPNFHPLIIGKQGLGKDTMLVPLIHAVGERNYIGVSGSDLSRNWTTFLQSRLVCVSETKMGGQNGRNAHTIANEMKKYLTCPPHSLEAEGKNIWKFKVVNCSAWIFFTNAQTLPMYVEEGDRRFWVIDSYGTAVRPSQYYVDLRDWLAANVDRVASYLMAQTLTQADIDMLGGFAPDTAAKQRLIQNNRPPLAAELDTIIKDAREGLGSISMVATIKDLHTALKDELPFSMQQSKQMIRSALHALGGSAVNPDAQGNPSVVKLKNGRSARLFLLADTDARGKDYTKLPLAEYAKIYENKGYQPSPFSVVETQQIV